MYNYDPYSRHGFSHAVLVASNAYDIAGNLLSATQASCLSDGSRFTVYNSQLHSYAADGSLYLTALDLNTNGVIDLAGPDRVTGSSAGYEKDASDTWWQVTRSWVYPEFNSSAAVTTSVQRTRLTGLGVSASAIADCRLLIADFSSFLVTSLSESLDLRGNATVSAALIDRAAKTVTRLSLSPTSVQPSIQTTVNGLLATAVSSTAVTNTYAYDALGRQTALTDGRGNTRATLYNALGQISATGDYLGDVPSLQLFAINSSLLTNLTSYAYDALGRRTEVTDALGNVTHTRYDSEGRAVATWGATYPVDYGYDLQGRMISMKTFRDENGPGDETRWLYENPTGLLTNKLYADGLGPAYTYTSDGKLTSRLWARGILTSYAYDAAGILTGVDYSDTTPDITYTYDRLGNTASVADASGIRTFTNDTEGQTLADAIQFQNEVFTLHEAYDTFGRSSGYALSNTVDGVSSLITGMVQNYDVLGRISEVSVADIPAPFRYGWLPGSDLQQSLAMPNGVTRQTAYDSHRDLLASITHTNAAGVVLTRRTFVYDASGRLTGRTQYRLGDETNRLDVFGYNPRSELTSAALGTNAYAYAFDPIGNRTTASELSASSVYAANGLNQYTSISNFVPLVPSCEFIPVFDLDGNQTLVKTTTGIWHVRYNGENRPVCFSNDTTVVEMAYDYQGRRFDYKETVNGVVTRHERYLYRNYLQIAALDLLNAQPRLRHTLVWDPTEPVATRPLCLQTVNDQQQTNGYYYSFDQVKNVTELFDGPGQVAATYDYAPFGAVTESSGPAVSLNPITFSSEIEDVFLDLVYYNYRHLDLLSGKWSNRDPKEENSFLFVSSPSFIYKKIFKLNKHLYSYCHNNSVSSVDVLGLMTKQACRSRFGEETAAEIEFIRNIKKAGGIKCTNSQGGPSMDYSETGDGGEHHFACTGHTLGPEKNGTDGKLLALWRIKWVYFETDSDRTTRCSMTMGYECFCDDTLIYSSKDPIVWEETETDESRPTDDDWVVEDIWWSFPGNPCDSVAY